MKKLSSVEESKKITVEDFISYYIQFEDDLLQNNMELKNKIINEKNNLNKYQEESFKYKNEKLNSEGFSENAKLTMEITDIEIKKNFRNVDTVILCLIYNKQIEEIKFDYSNDVIVFNKQGVTDNIISSLT